MIKDIKEERDYTYYELTQSLCRECRNLIDAQILFRADKVYIRSICPEHGPSETLISADVAWYLKTINSKQVTDRPKLNLKQINKGCPYDCGLCKWHEKACNVAILSVTNVCNLNCPLCFISSRKNPEYFMSIDEFEKRINWLRESEKQIDLLSIIGGEPTLHPDLFRLIELCEGKEIGRVALYSNGLRIAENEDIVKKLAEQDIVIIMSFSTLDRKTAKIIYGKDVLEDKLRALDNLERYKVQTKLLILPERNLNDKEISRIINFALEKDFIQSINIQTMHYNGRGIKKHLAIDEIIDKITKKTKIRFRQDDFSPLPGYHPHCYSVCFFFQDGKSVIPLKRIFTDDEYFNLLGKKYVLHPEENFRKILEDKIIEISSEKKISHNSKSILSILNKMINSLYPEGKSLSPFERQKMAENLIKSIYIHAPMNEDTFDVSRVIRCGDFIADKNQALIPACTHGYLTNER